MSVAHSTHLIAFRVFLVSSRDYNSVLDVYASFEVNFNIIVAIE